MLPRWQKMNALLGGTESMRAAERTYLPQHQYEKDDVYACRLETAVLLNMTELTLESWVGRPFSDPIQLNDDVPKEIAEGILEDVDLQGNELNVFARGWFRDGLAKSFSHVLVEFPRVEPRPDGQPRTLEDDRREKLRPYWINIPPENIIFARAEIINGVETLVHVRIQEEHTVMDGFEEVKRKLIRVLEPGNVRVYEYRKGSSGKIEWVLDEEYETGLDFIPLVTFYASRECPFLGKPPLLDLADLNISHWQSSADQRHCLTVARFPVLAASGVSDADQKLVVGPNKWLVTENKDGKFYYVEHTGAALAAGQSDLEALETQMAQYGAEFLRKRPGNETATARALDSAEATSPLQDVTVRFEDAVNKALEYTAAWMRIGENKGGTVKVNREFGPENIDAADLNTLDKARDRRDISRSAYIAELKRRAILQDEYDPEADQDELKTEEADMIKLMQTMEPPEQPPATGAAA